MRYPFIFFIACIWDGMIRLTFSVACRQARHLADLQCLPTSKFPSYSQSNKPMVNRFHPSISQRKLKECIIVDVDIAQLYRILPNTARYWYCALCL
ncbi:hypothetical protein BJ912DRAFT_980969, partial [Pholiota molesta]